MAPNRPGRILYTQDQILRFRPLINVFSNLLSFRDPWARYAMHGPCRLQLWLWLLRWCDHCLRLSVVCIYSGRFHAELGCLGPFLLIWFYLNPRMGVIFVCRKHDTCPYTGSGINTTYERIASNAGTQFRSLAQESSSNSVMHYHAEWLNHSDLTHPSKTNWH